MPGDPSLETNRVSPLSTIEGGNQLKLILDPMATEISQPKLQNLAERADPPRYDEDKIPLLDVLIVLAERKNDYPCDHNCGHRTGPRSFLFAAQALHSHSDASSPGAKHVSRRRAYLATRQ
jgi:hypothetical protein